MKAVSHGFSLLEIICVLVLLGVLGAAATIGFSRSVELYNFTKDNDVLAQQAQIALNRVLIEFTNIDQSATGADFNLDAPGTETPSTSYKFPAKYAGTTTDNTFSFDAASGRLSLNGEPLCDGVTAFSIQKDSSVAGVADLAYVKVDLSVSSNNKTRTFSTQITIKKFDGTSS